MFPFKRVLNFLSSNLVAIMLFLLTGIPLGASKSGGDDKEGEKEERHALSWRAAAADVGKRREHFELICTAAERGWGLYSQGGIRAERGL